MLSPNLPCSVETSVNEVAIGLLAVLMLHLCSIACSVWAKVRELHGVWLANHWFFDSRPKLEEMVPTSAEVANNGPNANSADPHPSALGLSFFMWVYLDGSDTVPAPAGDGASGAMPKRGLNQRQCLLRFLSVAGNGVEVFISNSGYLVVASAQAGNYFFRRVGCLSLFKFSLSFALVEWWWKPDSIKIENSTIHFFSFSFGNVMKCSSTACSFSIRYKICGQFNSCRA